MNTIATIVRCAAEQASVRKCVISEIEEEAKVFVELETENGRKLTFYLIGSDDDMEISLRMYSAERNVIPQRTYPYLNDINKEYHHFKCVFNQDSGDIDVYADFIFRADIIDSEIVALAALMISDLESLCEQLELSVKKDSHDEQLLFELISIIWSSVILKKLKDEYKFSDVSLKTWLLPVKISEIKHGTLRLKFPDKFCLPYLTQHYALPIREVIARTLHQHLEVEFY